MKNTFRLILSLGLLLLLVSCAHHNLDAPGGSGIKRLSARQVRELLNGSSVRLDGYGQTATVEFTGDGVMSGRNTAGEKDKGEWQLRGDTLCLQFKKWAQGDRFCYQVAATGDTYQLFNRKGMKIYELSVLTQGEREEAVGTPATMPSDAASGSSPTTHSSGPAPATAALPEPIPVSPHAAADVEFLIRQSAQNCPGCNLAHVNLSGMILIGANLQGANLTEANLSHANLRRANLRGANLYRADLRQADMAGADLTGANLSEALRE